MYNAASRLLTLAVMPLMVVGCHRSQTAPTPAQQALEQAQAMIDNARYSDALALFDSIDSLYPDEIDVRRQVIDLRPSVIESDCRARLIEIDSAMNIAEVRRAQLLEQMVQSSVQGFDDGYSTALAGHVKNFYSTTGIQGRVSTNGDFYIVSSLTGKPLRHYSITFTTPQGSVTTPAVPYDGELNLRTDGGEVVTYFGDAPSQIGELAQGASNAANPKVTVAFHGDKGDRTITLTDAQIEGIATTWEFANNYHTLRKLSLDRDRLTAMLALARQQQEHR